MVVVDLDEIVFCDLGVPEAIHTDQGAYFRCNLMGELYSFRGVPPTLTTPYHPQANEVVARGNRMLDNSLRIVLLNRSSEE